MGKRARKTNRRYQHIDDNVVMINQNQKAIQEGPKRKNWSALDIRRIQPITEKQNDMFEAWADGDDIVAHGSAGTGKTFIAAFLAIHELLEYKDHNKVLIVRSAVSSRDVGFLPGTLEEKTAQYELPYHDIFHDLFGRRSTYQDMKDAHLVEFTTTSFIRGLTWDNTIVIVDEIQNMSFAELDSVMTRIGKNSKILLCGDIKRQCDLKRGEVSGADHLLKATRKMANFSDIEFEPEDIVRSEKVKNWLIASNQT